MFFSSPSATLVINVAKPFYTPGETIVGSVTMNVKSVISLDSLDLYFKGEESVVLKEHRSQSNGNTTTHTTITHRTSRIWAQNFVALQSGKMQYQPGTYTVPFQFTLPSHIPGSATFNPGDGHAYISYIFNVEGVVPGVFSSNLRDKLAVPVVEIFNGLIKPVSNFEEAMVTTMCCYDVGSVRFRACLEKDAYRPGEMAVMNLYVDNTTSEVGYRYISVKLRQRHVAVAGPSNFTAASVKTLAKNRTPKIPAGETVHATIPLVFPMDTLPSVHGIALTLTYTISVVFSLRNSADIVSDLPITIFVVRTVQDNGMPMVQPVMSASPTPAPSMIPYATEPVKN